LILRNDPTENKLNGFHWSSMVENFSTFKNWQVLAKLEIFNHL